MGLLNGLKAVKDNLKEKVKEQISEDFLDAAKKGEFIVTQKYLEIPLRNAIKDEDGVELESIDFKEEGIILVLKVDKLGTSIACPLSIKVGDLTLSGDQQRAEVTIITQKAIGKNLLGKFATGLAGGIIDQIIISKIEGQEMIFSSVTKDSQTEIEIDLSQLAPIQKLNHPLPLLGKSPLDLITIKSVHHVTGGLLLKLEKVV